MTQFLPNEPTERCIITRELFTELEEQGNLFITSCGHKFSKIAMKDWMGFSSKCPSCSQHIDNVASNTLLNNSDEENLKRALKRSLTETHYDKDFESAVTASLSSNNSPRRNSVDLKNFNGEKVSEEEALERAIKRSKIEKKPESATSSSSSSSSTSPSALRIRGFHRLLLKATKFAN